ncbi:MAG: DUF2177 family protein [Pseudomonadota bacterium]
MTTLYLFLATGLTFLVIDVIWLTAVMQPLFQREVGPLLADPPRLGVAAGFYLIYIAGLVHFAGLPGLTAGPLSAAVNGGFIGLIAYGTYEMTNMATLRDWSWTLVVADTAWGIVLSAASAAGGVLILRALSGGAPS